MARRSDEIVDEINRLQNELLAIRSACPHPNRHDAMYSWRIGSYSPSEMCMDCGAFVTMLEAGTDRFESVMRKFHGE